MKNWNSRSITKQWALQKYAMIHFLHLKIKPLNATEFYCAWYKEKRRSVYAIMTDVWSIIMTSNKHVQDNNFQYVNHSLQITYLFFTTLFMKGSYNVCFIERKCNSPLSIHVIVLFRYFIIKITNRFLFVWISLYAFHCKHFDNFNEYWCENQVQDSLRS